MGINSDSYRMDDVSVRLFPSAGIRTPSSTIGSTQNVCEQIACAGSNFKRLEVYAAWATGGKRLGQTCAAVGGAVFLYLERVRVQIMSFHNQPRMVHSLFELVAKTTRISKQLHHLAGLFGVEAKRAPDALPFSEQLATSPRGVSLMTCLYDATCICHGQSHHMLIGSMFLAAAQPFLRFLEEWVWDGTLSDPQFEFGIVLDNEALQNKSHTYWSCATALERGCIWPSFMDTRTRNILTCGKSLILLRQCIPGHFLCSQQLQPPSLQLSFNPATFSSIKEDVIRYALQLATLAGTHGEK